VLINCGFAIVFLTPCNGMPHCRISTVGLRLAKSALSKICLCLLSLGGVSAYFKGITDWGRWSSAHRAVWSYVAFSCSLYSVQDCGTVSA